MARRKAQTPAEVLIAFFSTAVQGDCEVLLMTARTITAARFPPPTAAAVVKRKPRAPKPAPGPSEPKAPTPVVGAAQAAAAAQSPIGGTRGPGVGRRTRPPVADAVVATALGVQPVPTGGDLPDQGDPADRD